MVVPAGLVGGVLGAAVALWLLNREPSLTIYSSLPLHTERGDPDKFGTDMEKAIALALKERKGKAGKFEINYKLLEATTKDGELTPTKVQDNAREAAGDPETAVYIGDISSTSSIESIPILSKAKVPQISPASTRVGLTVKDQLVDMGEPWLYYPSRPDRSRRQGAHPAWTLPARPARPAARPCAASSPSSDRRRHGRPPR